jgi:hypothetical protein
MRTLVIAANSPSVSQPPFTPQLESMSTLFLDATVPKGKYRILPASNPTLALEMEAGNDFRVRIAELDETSEEQVVRLGSYLKFQLLAAHTSTVENNCSGRCEGRYQVQNQEPSELWYSGHQQAFRHTLCCL